MNHDILNSNFPNRQSCAIWSSPQEWAPSPNTYCLESLKDLDYLYPLWSGYNEDSWVLLKGEEQESAAANCGLFKKQAK